MNKVTQDKKLIISIDASSNAVGIFYQYQDLTTTWDPITIEPSKKFDNSKDRTVDIVRQVKKWIDNMITNPLREKYNPEPDEIAVLLNIGFGFSNNKDTSSSLIKMVELAITERFWSHGVHDVHNILDSQWMHKMPLEATAKFMGLAKSNRKVKKFATVAFIASKMIYPDGVGEVTHTKGNCFTVMSKHGNEATVTTDDECDAAALYYSVVNDLINMNSITASRKEKSNLDKTAKLKQQIETAKRKVKEASARLGKYQKEIENKNNQVPLEDRENSKTYHNFTTRRNGLVLMEQRNIDDRKAEIKTCEAELLKIKS